MVGFLIKKLINALFINYLNLVKKRANKRKKRVDTKSKRFNVGSSLKKHSSFYYKVEHLVDKSIPYLLILLFFIIIVEFFYHDYALKYEFWIDLCDYFIIFVFLIDLWFKWNRSRNFKMFLRTSWIDILAVVPFYLIFRLFEEIAYFARFGETLERTQKVLHETVEVEKEVFKIASEAEKSGKVTRVGLLERFFKPVQRFPRFLKAFSFYEKPFKHKRK